MKRFNVDAIIDGVAVTFGIENNHLVLFHDRRTWDDDAKNKLGLKSGRKRRYSSDLGAWVEDTATNEQLAQAVKNWKGFDVVFEDTPKPTAKPTRKPSKTTAKPSKSGSKAQAQQVEQVEEPKVFVAPTAPTATTTSGVGAFGAMLDNAFVGIKQEVTCNVLQAIAPYINSVQRVEHVVNLPNGVKNTIKGVVHDDFDKLLKLSMSGLNLYLFGPTGSGKSQIAKQIADAMGLQYYQQDKVTYVHEITGMMDAKGEFHGTPTYDAWTKGGVLCLDEFDAYVPDASIKLNGALSQGVMVFQDGKAYKKHPDCHIIATGNTNGTGATEEYTARYVGDASNYGRFFKHKVDYCQKIEQSIANNDVDLVDFVRQLRNIKKTKHLNLTLDYRAIAMMVTASSVTDKVEAINGTITNQLDEDTAKLLFRTLPDYNENEWIKTAKNIANAL